MKVKDEKDPSDIALDPAFGEDSKIDDWSAENDILMIDASAPSVPEDIFGISTSHPDSTVSAALFDDLGEAELAQEE